MSASEVVEWWDDAAHRDDARRFIHPTGVVNDDAYEASGEGLAATLLPLIGDAGLVIDFGCGDGRVTIPLSRHYSILGVDSSPAMIERLRALAPELPAMVSDGADLAENAYPADVILVLAVLIHHRHADAAVIIDHLARALIPGGRLILDLPLGDHPIETDSPIGVNQWTIAELIGCARACGLEVLTATPGELVVLGRP